MKRMFLVLWACAASFAAAMAQTPSYRVTGTVEGAADGDTVKMAYYKGWAVVPVADTVVKDGSSWRMATSPSASGPIPTPSKSAVRRPMTTGVNTTMRFHGLAA